MIWETENFFTQKIKIKNIEGPRFDWFKAICENKKVLHVGCADSMFFNPDQNLHLYLSDKCKELHGLDSSVEDIEKLKKYFDGKYFYDISECDREYDIILVPEVIEHVDNLKLFLDNIFSVKYNTIIITAPNIQHYSEEMKFSDEDGICIEIVHPDHKCWFSPYTMYNVTKKYVTAGCNHSMFYLENKSMICSRIDVI